MNSPSRVITFVNAAHFIDHYSMLIFAAAVIVMGPALGKSYSELLPYATPGFIAFGGATRAKLPARVWNGDEYQPGAARFIHRSGLVEVVLMIAIVACMVAMHFGL